LFEPVGEGLTQHPPLLLAENSAYPVLRFAAIPRVED
jgi:hypothetical protein